LAKSVRGKNEPAKRTNLHNKLQGKADWIPGLTLCIEKERERERARRETSRERKRKRERDIRSCPILDSDIIGESLSLPP
jgi:hypothetical protein